MRASGEITAFAGPVNCETWKWGAGFKKENTEKKVVIHITSYWLSNKI